MVLDLRGESGPFAGGAEEHVETAVVRWFADPLLVGQIGQVDLRAMPGRDGQRVIRRHHHIGALGLHDRARVDPGRKPQLEAGELPEQGEVEPAALQLLEQHAGGPLDLDADLLDLAVVAQPAAIPDIGAVGNPPSRTALDSTAVIADTVADR